MKNLIPAMVLLAFFIGLSLQYINVPVTTRRSEYRTSELKKVVTKEGNVTRTDYIDEDGNLRIAANAGYATKLVLRQHNSETETYFDDQGERISLYYGYYGILREYDSAGNNIRVTFLDENNDPVVTLLKYAVEEKEFNESGQQVSCRYYDTAGKAACSYYNGFGVQYEYDEKGRRVRAVCLDEKGKPMILSAGYSILDWQYYETGGSENGKVREEFYYLPDGSPASLSLGQSGIYMEYNENGQISLMTYLGADGSPIATNKGYTSVAYTYYADDSVQSTLYFDINGNPFRMKEGQYGIKNKNGQTVNLNADGTEQFNIKNYVYNHSSFVIVIAIMLVILSVFTGERISWLMLIIYIGVIVYFTLMYRETGKAKILVFRSYSRFFTNAELRASIIKNIWLFVPLGAILYRIWPRKIILFAPVIFSIIIETVQYFTGMGLCELDDVISNGMGGTVGYGMGCLMLKIRKQFYLSKHIPNM